MISPKTRQLLLPGYSVSALPTFPAKNPQKKTAVTGGLARTRVYMCGPGVTIRAGVLPRPLSSTVLFLPEKTDTRRGHRSAGLSRNRPLTATVEKWRFGGRRSAGENRRPRPSEKAKFL